MSVEIPDQREPLTQDDFANPVWFEFLSELARQHNKALARISTLEQQVADLETRISTLEQQVADLETRVTALETP